MLDPRGPVSAAEHTILIDSLAIMLAIVGPTILAALIFAFWFRAGNSRARRRPQFVYSGQIELVVWSIPLLTILVLGGFIWIGSHRLDPYRPLVSNRPTLRVQVVALDWKWLFLYPDQGIAAVNELTVPAGAPVHFDITSASVLNAFFVPQLGSLIYAMNGMNTQLNLQADAPGDYFGLSAHYSGDGFSDMHFTVHAVPQTAFETWVADTRRAGPALNSAEYARLAKQSRNVQPYTYRSADPALYPEIVTQQQPPGPGPGPGASGSQPHVHPVSGTEG